MSKSKLFLHEEVLLLAMQDEKGTIASGTWYTLALGGAILSELMMNKRIEVEAEGKKQFVRLISSKKLGEDVLDEALEKVVDAKRRATLQTWVNRFAGIRQMKNRVADGLCKRGILRADEKQILLFFTKRIYPRAKSSSGTGNHQAFAIGNFYQLQKCYAAHGRVVVSGQQQWNSGRCVWPQGNSLAQTAYRQPNQRRPAGRGDKRSRCGCANGRHGCGDYARDHGNDHSPLG